MGLIKYFLILLSSASFAFSLEFYIDSGREGNRNFAVLNLRDTTPFVCTEELNRNSEVSAVVCKFDASLFSRFQRSETLFFSIASQFLEGDSNGFYLRITPKQNKKIKLYNTSFDLVQDSYIPLEKNPYSKRWQILGYEDVIPFLDDKPSYGINFPIQFGATPSIGVLDVRMRPMNYQAGRDKEYFLNIQSSLERESYVEVLKLIDEMLEIFPDTIFKRDVMYLRLVALDGIQSVENYEEITTSGREWLSANSMDIHVPEVLFILAKTYSKMKFFEEAKYYYNRLFSEHKGNKFELLARLDYGEHLYDRGDRKAVLSLYESVLQETNDLEIASLASVLLGDYYRRAEDKINAERYLQDVLNANPGFFHKKIPKYYALMQNWAEFGIYATPAKALEVMFGTFEDKTEPLYLPMLRNMAIWFDRAGDLQKAHHYYQMFLKESGNEIERKEIKELDDILLLKDDESDTTKLLEHYDYVIANYAGKEEERIALEKKAQTYYKLGEYAKVFAMREVLDRVLGENHPVLLDAVSALTKNALLQQNCKDAAYYGDLYGMKISLTDSQFLHLFDCMYANKQYHAALEIAKKKSEDVLNAKQKEGWLYRLAWVEYSLQNYPRAALAARDTLNLLSDVNYNDSVWVLFMALAQQKKYEEAFKLLPTLEEKLKDSTKLIEVYRVVLQDALLRKDDTAIKVYAQKLMDLQTFHARYEYSPWVELAMVEALNREMRFQDSLVMLQNAQSKARLDTDLVQIYYLQGYLYDKLNAKDSAIQAYEKCEAINIQSPWKNLCIDAKRLLENQ